MSEHGFPVMLIRLICATLEGSKSCVQFTGRYFIIVRDHIQGDALSYLLFNKALEGDIRRAGVQRNGTIITCPHKLLGFADDIIGIDRQVVEESFVHFKRDTAKIGL